jgi:hypothetical protein
MRVTVIVLAALTVVTVFPTTSPAQPGPPPLAPAQLNCGDTKITGDSQLSEPEARHIIKSLAQVWKARATRSDWTHGRHLDAYTFAFCGTSTGGRHVVIVDGIYSLLGAAVCDDAAGFGVVYDPRSGQFGDFVFGVSSCVP